MNLPHEYQYFIDRHTELLREAELRRRTAQLRRAPGTGPRRLPRSRRLRRRG